MALEAHQTMDARHYITDEVLRDGKILQVRAIRPDDKERLLEHFAGLGARSRSFQFFGLKRALSTDDLVRFTELDFDRHVGLAATALHNGQERFIGVGRYVRTDLSSQAEIAVAVWDQYQGTGIGPLLIRHLAFVAHLNGIARFEADVLGDNRRMLTLLYNSGCIIHHVNSAGVQSISPCNVPNRPGLSVESTDPITGFASTAVPKGESHG